MNLFINMDFRRFIQTKILECLKEDDNGRYIKLQRGQFGDVEDGWGFNLANGQHGKGVYAFKYKDQPMIDYYTKNGEKLHTFQVPKKHFVDLSNKNWDFWDAKAYMYNNPQYKAFMFRHSGIGIPNSKEIVITDPNIIQIL